MVETLTLDSLEEWVKIETNSLVEPLREEAKANLETVRTRLQDLLESSEKLSDDANKELSKGSRKTYRRAKCLLKLAETFGDKIEKIVIPEKITAENLKVTAEQIEKTLKTIAKEKTKWFRAVSPYFIISRRRFDVALKRADDSFRDFTDFLEQEYSLAESAEEVPLKIKELRESLVELAKLESARENRKRRMAAIKLKIDRIHQNLQTITTKDEIIELSKTNEKIQELAKSVKHNLRHIQKPLIKFQTLADSPGYSLLAEETAKLGEYLNDPFKAFATEKEGYPLLKTIVKKIEKALDNKKMKLKSTRLRKAKDQMNKILSNNALLELQKMCREYFEKRYALQTSEVISETKDERVKMKNRLKSLQMKRRLFEVRDAEYEKQLEEAQRKADEQKRNLERIVSDLSTENVQIIVNKIS